MDDRKIVVRFPSEKRDFLFTETSRMALKLTPAASKMALGRLSWGEERLKREADHSLPPTLEVQKAWSCTSTPPLPSWRALE
jgi:hypothetical protein